MQLRKELLWLSFTLWECIYQGTNLSTLPAIEWKVVFDFRSAEWKGTLATEMLWMSVKRGGGVPQGRLSAHHTSPAGNAFGQLQRCWECWLSGMLVVTQLLCLKVQLNQVLILTVALDLQICQLKLLNGPIKSCVKDTITLQAMWWNSYFGVY